MVTGASRGIGREMATALAGAGYAVAAVGRDTGALATLERDVTAAGGRILVQRAEVTDPAEVDDCVGAVLEAFGRLDVLVNSAGVIEPEVPLWEAEVEQWWRTMTVNVRGPLPDEPRKHPAHDRRRRRAGGQPRQRRRPAGAG